MTETVPHSFMSLKSRREFLELGLIGAGALLLPKFLRASVGIATGKEVLLSSYFERSGEGICFFDLRTGQKNKIKLDSEPHSIESQAINHLKHYVALPKNGNKGYQWISSSPTTGTNLLPQDEKGLFYGHGCFSPHGDLFYASEKSNGNGLISIRETKNYRVIGSIPLGKASPHEIICENSQLIVACEGKRGEIVVIDRGSHKIISRLDFPSSTQLPRHITRFSENRYLVAPMAIPGQPNSFCSPFILSNGLITEIKVPEKLQKLNRGQILNLIYQSEFKSFYTCCPSGALIRWNEKSLEVESALYDEGEGVKNLVYLPSMSAFLGTDSLSKKLYRINPLTLSRELLISSNDPCFSIAHLSFA